MNADAVGVIIYVVAGGIALCVVAPVVIALGVILWKIMKACPRCGCCDKRESKQKGTGEGETEEPRKDVKNTQKDVEAQVAQVAQVAPLADLTRLMIYSSDTPDIDEFDAMVRCQKARYEFATDGIERLQHIIQDALAVNAGKPLKSIALACHGPPPDKDGGSDGPTSEEFYWPITKSMVVRDDKELLDRSNPVRVLMDEMGSAVESGTGRIDLLACSLLKSQEGREVFNVIEKETGVNFAASDDLTGNPKLGGDWLMASDNVDIRDFYFHSTVGVDGTFAAEADEESGEQEQLVPEAASAVEGGALEEMGMDADKKATLEQRLEDKKATLEQRLEDVREKVADTEKADQSNHNAAEGGSWCVIS